MVFMSSPSGNTRHIPGTGKSTFSIRKRDKDSDEMPFTCLEDLQRTANATLRAAMADERSKRWTKVVKNYRRLLRMLHKENLPPDLELPPWYRMLMYESHYHLGLALQNGGENRRAVAQYSKALDAVFIPKNGCEAGCTSNSCLMTPLYTRRAFAYSKIGENKLALKDAEQAVVLDSKNPDVYCVRALVRNTRGEEQEALKDVQAALRYNDKHLCSLILRGSLAQPLASDEIFETADVRNEDHIQACSINPDCHNYLHVNDFKHGDINAFYDRFLYSLNVPHTVSDIVLVSSQPGDYTSSNRASSVQHHSQDSRAASQSSLKSSAHESMETNPMKFKQNIYLQSGGQRAFKCGMQKQENCDPKQVVLRRKQYGQAIREHMSRPKTADEYLAFLQKQRVKKKIDVHRKQRAHTAVQRDIERNTPTPYRYTTPSTGDPELDKIAASLRTHKTMDGRTTKTTQTVISAQPSSLPKSSKSVRVFMEVNVDDAPRMYYRPWLGDKLPVSELPKRTPITPAFKC